MGEYLYLVNHTREEVVTPLEVNRGLKMYQWMSECTSSMGMYLLLNTGYSDDKNFAGLWAGDNIELIGDTKGIKFTQNYTDITSSLFREMESSLEKFPEDMDSGFAKQVLADYKN
jgi:virulence-associated protein VapD